MKVVTLINPFAVPREDREKFLTIWQRVDDYMQAQPGFMETHLHESIEPSFMPNATFRFINVALWRSAEDFKNAIQKEGFVNCAKHVFPYSGGAGLYQVISLASEAVPFKAKF